MRQHGRGSLKGFQEGGLGRGSKKGRPPGWGPGGGIGEGLGGGARWGPTKGCVGEGQVGSLGRGSIRGSRRGSGGGPEGGLVIIMDCRLSHVLTLWDECSHGVLPSVTRL
eukprot:395584-Prorocentrum_minimum.AAC.1